MCTKKFIKPLKIAINFGIDLSGDKPTDRPSKSSRDHLWFEKRREDVFNRGKWDDCPGRQHFRLNKRR